MKSWALAVFVKDIIGNSLYVQMKSNPPLFHLQKHPNFPFHKMALLIRNPYRLEAMEHDELAFIERRYVRESKTFYLGMRWVLLVIVVLPLLVILFHENMEKKDGLSGKQVWIYAQTVTVIIYLFVFLAGYIRLLLPYVRDLKKKNKVVEQVIITEKKFMPHNNSYHFYVNSINCYSVEVNREMYESLEVNDELCIEYAGNTEIYLGYF